VCLNIPPSETFDVAETEFLKSCINMEDNKTNTPENPDLYKLLAAVNSPLQKVQTFSNS
jgi:hypothetical protein